MGGGKLPQEELNGMEGSIQGALLEKDGSHGESQGIGMDFPLGARCWVEDVKYRGFAELGLQRCKGLVLGSTPLERYVDMSKHCERCGDQ